MEYSSFEEALQVCMRAASGSPEQRVAMEYCLQHAPADLRMMLAKRLGLHEQGGCREHGCECGEG